MSFEQPITDVVAYRASKEEMRRWGYTAEDFKLPMQKSTENARELEATHRPISAHVAKQAAEQAMRNEVLIT